MKEEKQKKGRADVINIGLIDTPTTFNPFTANTIWDQSVLNLLFDTLVTSASGEPYLSAPSLAQKWEWHDDSPKLRLILRDDVKWHDGTPFTAEDVKFTFETIIEFEIPKLIGSTFFVDEIEVVDDHTIDFSFSETRSTFVSVTLCNIPILPKHLWNPVIEDARRDSNPIASLTHYSNDNPVGTGPFKFAEFEKGKYVRLESNENYFAGSPHIDGIFLKVVRSDERSGKKYLDDYASEELAFKALRKGELDYVAVHYPISTALGLLYDPDPKISISLNPINGLLYVAFNCRRKPFDDASFRKAVACFVDREQFCSQIYMGQSLPAYTIMPANDSFWKNPNTTKFGQGWKEKQRLEKARGILADAGYSWRNDKILMPDGQPMWDLNIVSDERVMGRRLLVAELALRLAKLGIPITSVVKPQEFVRTAEHGFSHHFDIMVSEYWFGLPQDPDFLCALFHSSQAKRGFNSSGYANPKFDELAIQQRCELNTKKRKKIVWEMQDLLAEDLPWIPVASNIRIEFYRNDSFEGWVKRPKGLPPYYQKWSYLNLRRVKSARAVSEQKA